MSDTQTPVEDTPVEDSNPVEDSTDLEAVADAEQPDPEQSPEDEAGNSEAARWRRKLREAEAERDALAQRLEAVQRQQVETLLGGVKPQAVWAVAELADLLNEEGGIDPEKVSAAVEAARERFGITKPAKGNHIPGVGNQPSSLPKGDAWKEAFAPSRRR